MSHHVYKKLVETVVEPVLFYGAGIWGYRKFPAIESVLNKAKRLYLGVGKYAPNLAISGDLGWASAETKQKLEVVRLWCRLRNLSDDRLVRHIHLLFVNKPRTWEKQAAKLFNDLNISNIMLIDKPCKSLCIRTARDVLFNADISSWHAGLHRNGSVDNGNKLRTYRCYKKEYCTENYVLLNMNRDQRRILAKFRSCNLPLAIETGRYSRPKTPLHERLCKYCESSSIEDETHFLIDCEFYSDLRYNLFCKANILHPCFELSNSDVKLTILMNSSELQYVLADTLLSMCKRRKHTRL